MRECPSACARCVSNMDPGRAGPFAMSVEITRSPPLCRVFIALFRGSMMPIVGCFFRPGGKLGGVIRLEHARFSYASPHIIFPPKLRMRIWPPIHPGKANPPFLPSFPTTEKTTGGGSASLFNLVAAQTAHVRAAHLCRVLFNYLQTFASVRDSGLKTAHCSTEMSSGEK